MAQVALGYVMCILPRAGLGNQLFPLMKAVVFANTHQLPLRIIGFHQIKIGPYLRGEKTKRQYSGYFKLEKNILLEWFNRFKFKYFNSLPIEAEPKLDSQVDKSNGKVYLFDSFDYRDYFYDLRGRRELVLPLFWNVLTRKIKEEFTKQPHPVIGVHIRRGDFREEWRTSEDYFINVIRSIRKIGGADFPVSIFTDGHAHELKNILALSNVNLVEGNKDMVDLLLLSKSKIIVVSSGSTFGYWASFLSSAPLILPPGHSNKSGSIRENTQNQYYEGEFDVNNEFMIQQVRQAFLTS